MIDFFDLEINDILKYFLSHSAMQKVFDTTGGQKPNNVLLNGLFGSSVSFVVSALFNHSTKNILFLLNDKEQAAYSHNDICNILENEEESLFFPSSYKRQLSHDSLDTASVVLRTEVMNKISVSEQARILVSYPGAIAEKVLSREKLEENTLQLKVGEKIGIEFITEILHDYHFERSDFVFEPGQFSIRGSIVDIFSFSNDVPFRIDFFGDEVESIRTFDIENQLSLDNFNEISIVPNIQDNRIGLKQFSIFDFIPKDTIVVVKDPAYFKGRIDQLITEAKTKYELDKSDQKGPAPSDFLLDSKQFIDRLKDYFVIETGRKSFFSDPVEVNFRTSPQPAFNKDFELLSNNLFENYSKGFVNVLFSSNQKQIDRLQAIFNEINKDVEEFSPVLKAIHEGFIDHDLQLCCYTDHQIFERYHKFRIKSNFAKKESITIRELTGLHPGDYVVHADHGIGKFAGLTKVEKNGKPQEAIRLVYKNDDILLVSIHNLHRISKYKSKDGESPKVHKLGGASWQKLKARTKSRVKDIARELISLYAARKSKTGFRFSTDTFLQNELEASFIYEDTPDQIAATQAVKADLESTIPMDRLICGDVGFGKTEIAIRAAFKAVSDSKQVAILVPTTILAMQHYYTFAERLENFPCSVDYISRLKKTSEQKSILKKLKEGNLDIIIGTHRLVGKDIHFKDLGLLIIDEEQKFGVAVKEKLKALKVNVDTLTLTATPIPRTLQFSLMGARDLSTIKTPPPNRYPIFTELTIFNPDVIRDAINYEIERNGQVFIIHNRIQNIFDIEALINKLCPKVKTVVGHGQMEGKKLEDVMLGFIEGDYDVLIATTIIENGLDIPNANTIIINNAQNFGLSDLHQLRGRVGRSNKKAFCYLIAPPIHTLPAESRRRLKAIESFSELGSGFNIALSDLDIRGAGNLLGGEQSGFISDIGFETYHRILDEALLELRDNEYKELFAGANKDDESIGLQTFVTDCNIETDLEVLLPDSYISNVSERIRLYRELDNIKDEKNLLKFGDHLIDRFGQLPPESVDLLNIVRLRWIANQMGLVKLVLKNKKLICYFIDNQESAYYQSEVFGKVLTYIQFGRKKCRMKEANNKLSLIFENVDGVQRAIDVLGEVIK